MTPTGRGPDERLVVGWREWLYLPDLSPEPLKAKVDTGARTLALHAWDVELDERPDGPWLRFNLHPRQDDDDHVVRSEAPLVDEREVRSSNGDVETRFVIATTVAIGGRRWRAELSLTRRDEMGFRMLLGRSALRPQVLVDPRRSFLHGGDRHAPPLEVPQNP